MKLDISKILKALRKNSSKTQGEVAEFLGITRQAYSRYESNIREPDLKTLKQIAEYFDVSPQVFFIEDHEKLLDGDMDIVELVTRYQLKKLLYETSTDKKDSSLEQYLTEAEIDVLQDKLSEHHAFETESVATTQMQPPSGSIIGRLTFLSVRVKFLIFGLIIIILSVGSGYLIVTPQLTRIEEERYIDEVQAQFELYNNSVDHYINDLYYAVIILQQEDEIYEDSSGFTNYLTAFDDGFTYAPSATEQSIILAMFDFALTNPDVDSIYIGYEETGAFVRTAPIQASHDAGEGFNYDPRERSWYTNAMSNPGEFVFNDIDKHPIEDVYYSTLSTTLVDENEEIIGVIGVDIHLRNYLDNFKQLEDLSDGQFVYTQGDKAIVFSEANRSVTISSLDELYDGLAVISELDGFKSQELTLDGDPYFAVSYQIPQTSIRFVHLIEDAEIRAIVFDSVNTVRNLFIIITFSIILLNLIVINSVVLKPLDQIERELKEFRKAEDMTQFVFSEDQSKEFAQIAGALNSLVDEISHRSTRK